MSEEPLDIDEDHQKEACDIANSDLEDARKKIKNAGNSSKNITNNLVRESDTKQG